MQNNMSCDASSPVWTCTCKPQCLIWSLTLLLAVSKTKCSSTRSTLTQIIHLIVRWALHLETELNSEFKNFGQKWPNQHENTRNLFAPNYSADPLLQLFYEEFGLVWGEKRAMWWINSEGHFKESVYTKYLDIHVYIQRYALPLSQLVEADGCQPWVWHCPRFLSGFFSLLSPTAFSYVGFVGLYLLIYV